MHRASARLSSISLLFTAAIVASGLLLSGCGGSSNNTASNTPPAASSSPQPGSGGSGGAANSGGSSSGGSGSNGSSGGGSASGGSGSGSGSGAGNSGGSGSGGTNGSGSGGSGNSATSISGTVLNAQTDAPVNGTVVVALESGPSDYTVAMSTSADAQGHFRFDNVTPTDYPWLIAVSAKSSDGTVFAPTYLVSGNSLAWSSPGDQIKAGTDVGTITVMSSPTTKLTYTVTSQNSASEAQDVNVTGDPLSSFTFDRFIAVPWLTSAPTFATHAGDPACANQPESCATLSITVPTARVWWAVYDHNGNQFKPWGTPNNFKLTFSATSEKTGAQDCNPSTQPGYSGNLDSPSPSAVHFQGCTP